MSGKAFNRGVCRGNHSLWFGLVGEGSRRPIWIWGNPDSPSEPAWSTQPVGNGWEALLAPGLLFHGMFSSCKTIVLKQIA